MNSLSIPLLGICNAGYDSLRSQGTGETLDLHWTHIRLLQEWGRVWQWRSREADIWIGLVKWAYPSCSLFPIYQDLACQSGELDVAFLAISVVLDRARKVAQIRTLYDWLIDWILVDTYFYYPFTHFSLNVLTFCLVILNKIFAYL